jgi:CheY-like chemotaxis protein
MVLEKFTQLFKAKAPDYKHIKILVIEDNPVDQKVAVAAIEKGGYTALWAIDGKTGLEMAQAKLPDLIILDYNLPDSKGPEICKTLKNDDATRHIPVLFLTSMDSPGSVIDCYEKGGENYLYKPIKPNYLLKQIEQTLHDRKMAQ